MLGIDYASSDEEEAVQVTNSEVRLIIGSKRASIATDVELTNTTTTVAPLQKPVSGPAPLEQPPVASGSIKGPYQGPTVSLPPADSGAVDSPAPGSPYTSARVVIQNLTLPTVPNFNIPPSPPSSPPQKATKKFVQFLELKKKGQHFNQRLESSSVLRDPGHLQKLLGFARVSEEDSYASTLPEHVAMPTTFPEWAYVEELRVSQRRILKANEQAKSKAPRAAINFVSATKSGTSSGTGTPSEKVLQQDATEKVVAGIDQAESNVPSSQNASKRKQLEHRSRDDSSSRSGWSSRSRSPKRRRSRSRDRR